MSSFKDLYDCYQKLVTTLFTINSYYVSNFKILIYRLLVFIFKSYSECKVLK